MLFRTRVWIAGVRGEPDRIQQRIERMVDMDFSRSVTPPWRHGSRRARGVLREARYTSKWITRVPSIKASWTPRQLSHLQRLTSGGTRARGLAWNEQPALEIFTRGRGVKVPAERMLTFQLEKRLNLYPVQ